MTIRKILFFLGLSIYLATALRNIGFIALDDYSELIDVVIPAGRSSFRTIIENSGVRSPLPGLLVAAVGRMAPALGIAQPVHQLRFLLVFFGALAFCLHGVFAYKHFRLVPEQTDQAACTALFLVSFYFLCPLFLTRLMFESLSAPFLTVSSYFACRYYQNRRLRCLLWSCLFLAVASVFRFQLGVCFLALVTVVLVSRRVRDLLALGFMGLGLFFLTGGIDLILRGQFHAALRAYVDYNLHYSSTYGISAFYLYALLFFGMTLPPTLFFGWDTKALKREWGILFPAAAYFLFFFVCHSLVPHKEERFVIPVLPLFLILMVPIATQLRQQTRGRWRLWYFLCLNFSLLFLTSFNIAQNNVVSLAVFLEKRPEISTILDYRDSIVFFPTAFIRRKLSMQQVTEIPSPDSMTCQSVLVVRKSLKGVSLERLNALEQANEFHPGILEKLLVVLNPSKNERRDTLTVYARKDCPRIGSKKLSN